MRSLPTALAVALALLAAAPARADEKTKAIEERLDAAKKSLVTVELTSRIAVERLPGLGEGGRRVVRTEATGVVVSDDGLVVLAAARLDPMAAAFALLGSRARAEVERVLVVGLDGKSRDASWVGRDDDKGLAYVRISPIGRAGLAPLGIPDTLSLPGIGEELAVVSITPRALGRVPRVDVARVSLVTAHPRRLLGTTPSLGQSLGGVVFRVEGAAQPVGLLVGLPSTEAAHTETDGGGADVLAPDALAMASGAFVLPDSDLVASIRKPPTEARAVAVSRRARSWIGIKPETLTPELAKAHAVPLDDGIRVAKVYKGTPAEGAGLAENDVITRLDGELISLDPGESFRSVEDLGVGQKVRLTIFHEGKGREVEVQLAEAPVAPEDAARAKLAALDGSARDLTFFDRDELGLAPTTTGAVLVDLDPDGAGARAGLRVGDIVLQVEGKDVPSTDGLREALGDSGERALAVRRGSEKLALKLRR
jgi:S1-C subfamily serine protease